MIISIIAIALSQGATPLATARQPDQAPITVRGQTQRADDQVVCKTTSTGTLIPSRICKTRGEWTKMQTDARDQLDRMREFQRIR